MREKKVRYNVGKSQGDVNSTSRHAGLPSLPPLMDLIDSVKIVIDCVHETYLYGTVKVDPTRPRKSRSRADYRVSGVNLNVHFTRRDIHCLDVASLSEKHRHPPAIAIPRLPQPIRFHGRTPTMVSEHWTNLWKFLIRDGARVIEILHRDSWINSDVISRLLCATRLHLSTQHVLRQ